jgi:hypothetical protein
MNASFNPNDVVPLHSSILNYTTAAWLGAAYDMKLHGHEGYKYSD